MSGVFLKFARECLSWSGKNKDKRKEEMGKRRKERRDGGGREERKKDEKEVREKKEEGWEEGTNREKGTEKKRKKGKEGKEQGEWKRLRKHFYIKHLTVVTSEEWDWEGEVGGISLLPFRFVYSSYTEFATLILDYFLS